MNVITMSAIAVTLFLGGPSGPALGFLPADGWFNVWVMPVFWFMFKLLVLLFGTVWLRASLPRLRYDQLMDLGWKCLIEIAFLWVMVTGVVVVAQGPGLEHAGSSRRARDRRRARASAPCSTRLDAPSRERASRRRRSQLSGLALRASGSRCGRSCRPRSPSEYPSEKRPKPERFHGRHVLNRYEDGMEKCIGCELCAGVCPAQCIYVRGADNPPDAPVSPGERYGFVYEINYLRCIHCDLCVEACPTEAITETKLFEFSFTNRDDAIYTKDELLVGDDGRARRLPWELWLGGEDDDTSAWMRGDGAVGRRRLRGSGRLVGRARLRRAPARGRPVGDRRRASSRPAPGAGRRSTPSTAGTDS